MFWRTLVFLVDDGHVSAFNFDLVISTIITFTDATSGRTPGEGAAALHLMHKCFRTTDFTAAAASADASRLAVEADADGGTAYAVVAAAVDTSKIAGANPARDAQWRGMLDKVRAAFAHSRRLCARSRAEASQPTIDRCPPLAHTPPPSLPPSLPD